MSLAIDLTSNQVEIEKAEREASHILRSLRGKVTPAAYCALQVQLCIIASESTKLKVNLGTLRMIGELEQRPPAVTVDRLELARCVPMVPAHAVRDQSAEFALELAQIADDTLQEGTL